MRSMTGYGRCTVERDGRQITMELKSVNHRFLDIAFRMPRSFAFLEDDLRKLLSKTLSRGHIDVFATYVNRRDDAKSVTVDIPLLNAYREALATIAAETGANAAGTAFQYAALSDVLVVAETEDDREALRAIAKEAMAGAIEELVAMREREGAAMADDVRKRLQTIMAFVDFVEAREPDMIREYETRLRERVAEWIGQNVDETRLLQEVAIMTDRAAIAEETVRLRSHVSQMLEALSDSQSVGRKLDFIVQELNREVNTISSKSQDIPITQEVVKAKTEIEKIREQVQNIE